MRPQGTLIGNFRLFLRLGRTQPSGRPPHAESLLVARRQARKPYSYAPHLSPQTLWRELKALRATKRICSLLAPVSAMAHVRLGCVDVTTQRHTNLQPVLFPKASFTHIWGFMLMHRVSHRTQCYPAYITAVCIEVSF